MCQILRDVGIVCALTIQKIIAIPLLNCFEGASIYYLKDEFEVCDQPKKCINCDGPHSSLDRTCLIYIKNKETNAIKAYNKLTTREAQLIYNERNSVQNRISYANTLKNNLFIKSSC
jgi:hypothetical protein